jgi:hypothetical protein
MHPAAETTSKIPSHPPLFTAIQCKFSPFTTHYFEMAVNVRKVVDVNQSVVPPHLITTTTDSWNRPQYFHQHRIQTTLN